MLGKLYEAPRHGARGHRLDAQIRHARYRTPRVPPQRLDGKLVKLGGAENRCGHGSRQTGAFLADFGRIVTIVRRGVDANNRQGNDALDVNLGSGRLEPSSDVGKERCRGWAIQWAGIGHVDDRVRSVEGRVEASADSQIDSA
jgi:hypothetical protein